MFNSSSTDNETDQQSANTNTATAACPATTPAPDDRSTASLSNLLNTSSSDALVPISARVSSAQVAALIDAKPLSPPAKRRIRRNGRVACLPKHARDVVNRMLWNGIAYKNIVEAVSELGFTITERNVSSWATGGHAEWRIEQEAVLQNRLDQDHLIDLLRRDGAPELSEVGLQAASTHLSQLLLRKLAQGDDPEANLKNYSQIIDMLCRLRRETSASQEQRDDERRRLGPEYDPARVKEEEELNAIEFERDYSNPPSGSGLAKPAEPPFLLPIPTASFNAEEHRQQRQDAQLAYLRQETEQIRRLKAKLAPASHGSQPASPTLSATAPAPAAPSQSASPPQSTNGLDAQSAASEAVR
jgi:hypothetical protein